MSEPQKPENRAGLTQIAYRITDYTASRDWLISLLRDSLRPGNQQGPLFQLTTHDRDDAAIALIDAWSVLVDVLTFYQERIANEGYLRTATERRSVLELARMIGYELNPGVAASTYFAFTLEDAPGSPDTAPIPKGTQVVSVPRKMNCRKRLKRVKISSLVWSGIISSLAPAVHNKLQARQNSYTSKALQLNFSRVIFCS